MASAQRSVGLDGQGHGAVMAHPRPFIDVRPWPPSRFPAASYSAYSPIRPWRCSQAEVVIDRRRGVSVARRDGQLLSIRPRANRRSAQGLVRTMASIIQLPTSAQMTYNFDGTIHSIFGRDDAETGLLETESAASSRSRVVNTPTESAKTWRNALEVYCGIRNLSRSVMTTMCAPNCISRIFGHGD